MIAKPQRLGGACGVGMLLACSALACRTDAHEHWAAPAASDPILPPRSVPRPQRPPQERPAHAVLRAVPPQQLCISLGGSASAQHLPWINMQPEVRATIADSAGAQAAITFRYLGPTPAEKRLRSGRLRKQLGLKLFSEDTCNLLYVMWRFDPPSQIAVSLKRNPGQSSHVECTNHGYRNLRPSWSVPVAAPAPQTVHELAARVEGSQLSVSLDDKPVLRADLGGEPLPERGLAGLRSDNVAFELVRLQADLLHRAEPATAHPCRAGHSGED